MPTISPTLPNDGETIDAQDVNGPFNAILGVLNGNIDDQNVKPGSLPWSVMDSFSNQIPASAMQDSGNLEKFREDSNISFIPDGLIWSATTGLAGAMTSGSYYSNSGILLPVTAIASKTFTASKDTYVSIAQNGAIAYSEVANGAAQPSLPSNSNWLAKVVTSGAAVTSVTDMRQTAPIASHNVDFATFILGFVKTNTNQSGISNTETDLTDMNIKAYVPNGAKRVKVSVMAPSVVATNVGARTMIRIYEDSTEIGRFYFVPPTLGLPLYTEAYSVSPTPGAHTYKATAVRENGSGTFTYYGDADTAKTMIVEVK
jgi:hypothetical protein